ncbi:hypothetical protein PO883_02130 [Massilia sp. DJPM01]|uniref:hypothetical protein n=1 Tax=Massilia sp. DJPM01 TaxID=3024404 RepID=UPI00259ED817|nr:hypothetical protein [Massilia sp. DJPM01]MDM5175997.1 hypothetical protein [Massilia sp. DJPM01]
MSPATGCWRDGNLLVVPADASLPARCVKCNASAQMGKPQRFSCHDPKWDPLISINFIVHIVMAAALQESTKVAIGLCDRHRRRRRCINLISLAILGLGIATVVAAVIEESVLVGSLAGFFWLLAAIFGSFARHVLTAVHVSKSEARLKGAGAAFLDSLPTR